MFVFHLSSVTQHSTVITKPGLVTIRIRAGRVTFPLFVFNIPNDQVRMKNQLFKLKKRKRQAVIICHYKNVEFSSVTTAAEE